MLRGGYQVFEQTAQGKTINERKNIEKVGNGGVKKQRNTLNLDLEG